MRSIEIFRLRRVRDKVRALAAIRTHAGWTEADALVALHQAIGGGRPHLHLPDDAAARACIAALAATGFVARFAPATDFDATDRAQAAVLAVLPRAAPALADAVGALLLAGDGPAALEHALLHLRQHAPEGDADRALLERTAIETGLIVGTIGRA